MLQEDKEIIRQLREQDTHFALIFIEHQQLDQEVKRLAKDPVGCHFDALEQLKKHKLKLKDEIHSLIKLAKQNPL